jgi:hypothetical protein
MFCMFHFYTFLIGDMYDQIIIPHFMHSHHTVYMMNKYTGTVDIFDSTRYTGLKNTSRSMHHEDRIEVICRKDNICSFLYMFMFSRLSLYVSFFVFTDQHNGFSVERGLWVSRI